MDSQETFQAWSAEVHLCQNHSKQSLTNTCFTSTLTQNSRLERDIQLTVQLNPKISVGKTIYGDSNWVSFISGHWHARWGKGTVVPGGQEKQLVAHDLSTHVDSNFILQTHDQPPAYITVSCQGWRVGPPEILESLSDTTKVDSVDPKSYSFRTYLQMETGHPRYLHLNTGMWVGSGIKRSADVVFDFYKVV